MSGVVNVVTDFGADPTGATDSATAIQNAINAVGSGYGGIVFFPPGLYKVGTVLTVSVDAVVLRGCGMLSSQIQGVGATQGVLSVTGSYFECDSLAILGPSNTVMTGGSLITANGSQGSKWTNLFVANAYVAFDFISSTNNLIQFCKGNNIYGPVLLNDRVSGGDYITNNQFDGSFQQVQTSPSSGYAAWVANHTYAANSVAFANGGMFGTRAGGVSASSGSGPTITVLGTPISDGMVTWYFLCAANYNVINVTNGAHQNWILYNDLTGPSVNIISVDNADGTIINGNQGGGAAVAAVKLGANCTHTQIIDNYFTALGYGIVDVAGTSSSITIANNILTTIGNSGISMSSPYTSIRGNTIESSGLSVPSSAAIVMGASTSSFTIADNMSVASGAQVTAGAAGYQVLSGASNHYVITNNTAFGGFSVPVSDAGSGSQKNVSGNIG